MKPLDPDLLTQARPARGYVILTAALGFITSGFILAQALLIAAVLAPVVSQGAGLSDVRTPLIALACVVVARATLAGAQTRFAHRAAVKVIITLREQILNHVLQLGPRWLSAPTESGTRASDTHTLVTRGLDDLRPYFVNYLPQLLLTATVTPVALAVVFGLDLTSGLIIFFTLPLVPIFMILVGTLTQNSSQRRLVVMSRLGAQVLDLLAGLGTLRAFGREIGPAARVKKLGDAYTASTMRTLRVAFLSGMVLELLTTLSVALVAVAMGLRLVYGNVGLEAALAVIVLAPEVYLPLRQVGQHFHASTNGIAAWQAAKNILDLPVPPAGTAMPPNLASTRIVVTDLTVVSTERGLAAPDNLSVTAAPGTITALRGASGSGKTTTVLALLGLLTPTSGDVTLVQGEKSYPLSQLDTTALWKDTVWLSQRAALPPASIAEILNVAQHSPERLTQAFSASGLDAVIADLPNGLNTTVGHGGLGLSVGQRQRVQLAQAFLSDAQLVILDEPTAHLDAGTESTVIATIRSLADSGRTVIVIAHRTSLLNVADTIADVTSRPHTQVNA
ncbi:thiol reductant ABC exporter subunit CydD [Jonesia quinghaiensis]|uniref:thiol reductant ABC exporter subunit CydD n=1 Tax=Jonesia quinghaiensis TaxID=262806 RepID=UPI0004210BCA|nr:thiol reductant ABC exporter subunit CydD [Jonesia quinghaiensis]